MGWRDLLSKADDHVVAPWLGGRSLRLGPRKWRVEGELPAEHGWYVWNLQGRVATLKADASPWDDAGRSVRPVSVRVGYLVGMGLLGTVEPGHLLGGPEALRGLPRVHLLPPDLDHFARVRAGVAWAGGPLLFMEEEFPLGPEDEVRDRYLDEKGIEDVANVPPALELAFRALVWRREREKERREEIRAAREREEQRRRIVETLGDGAARRALAKEDFEEAAKAALAVGGAEFLECRRSHNRGEYVVRYRLDGSRYECVCDDTMHIIDAGICLQDHDTGEKGDTYFTLESLPGVTRQAMREGAVVWRHV